MRITILATLMMIALSACRAAPTGDDLAAAALTHWRPDPKLALCLSVYGADPTPETIRGLGGIGGRVFAASACGTNGDHFVDPLNHRAVNFSIDSFEQSWIPFVDGAFVVTSTQLGPSSAISRHDYDIRYVDGTWKAVEFN